MSDSRIDFDGKPLSPWRPEQRLIVLAVLGKLAEELGEASAIVARCVIQGVDESEPVTEKLNREALEDEIADVLATAHMAIDRLGLDRHRIHLRATRKRDHLAAWHALIE